LSSTGHWERKPQEENELEGVVEGEPVDSAKKTLKDRKECKDDPVCKPLRIVSFAGSEQSLQRVVSGKHEASEIGKKLTANVEEDEEEVGGDQSKEGVDLWDRGLLLEVDQSRVFGEFPVDLSDMPLSFVLE